MTSGDGDEGLDMVVDRDVDLELGWMQREWCQWFLDSEVEARGTMAVAVGGLVVVSAWEGDAAYLVWFLDSSRICFG